MRIALIIILFPILNLYLLPTKLLVLREKKRLFFFYI